MTLYTVNQYRPAYFSGFENAVVKGVPEADLMNPEVLPWLKGFMHDDVANYTFVEFYLDRDAFNARGDPIIFISARYNNGKHWIAAIARPENTAQ